MRIYLSHYSLNMLHNSSHQWVCKMMGIQPPNNIYFEGGNQGQRIIQEYVSGRTSFPQLTNLTYRFPVVEEKDFDERTKFVKEIREGGDTFILQGFADGLNYDKKQMLEIKLSGTPWSLGKFQKSMQRKLYAWGFPKIKKAILVTGTILPKDELREAKNSGEWESWSKGEWRKRMLANWEKNPPVQMECSMTKKDAEQAEDWIMEGIKIFRKGDFTGGLENGVCNDFYCGFGENCHFK